MRILVVEDEGNVAELILDALRGGGHQCLVARDAEEAEKMLGTDPVDGITLDLRMPGRDGLEWLEALSESRPDLARRTLVVTGADLSPDDCSRLARSGAGMLAKPFTVDDLLDTLVKQVAHVRLPRTELD